MRVKFKAFVIGITAIFMLFIGSLSRAEVSIDGAGATFPYPVYVKWAASYQAKTGVEVNYRPTGSGDGIKQISARLVDFGASDIPLSPVRLDKDGLVQFPTVVGGVVPVVNIQGVAPGRLKLNAATLAGIYLGKITKWNDPALLALNAGMSLPDEKILPVHFSDASGTTYIFTNYLSRTIPEWKTAIGEGAVVPWKVGATAKHNDEVASFVQRTRNSIGYVEFSYALKNQLSYAQMQNREGFFVAPGEASFSAAAGAAQWEDTQDFIENLTDKPGKGSWPICGGTYILVQQAQNDAVATRDVLKFFDWAYANGGRVAIELGYVPLPERVQNLVRRSWREQVQAWSAQSRMK